MCVTDLSRRTRAWWDREAKKIVCLHYRLEHPAAASVDETTPTSSATPGSAEPSVEPLASDAEAGASARRERDRRRANRERETLDPLPADRQAGACAKRRAAACPLLVKGCGRLRGARSTTVEAHERAACDPPRPAGPRQPRKHRPHCHNAGRRPCDRRKALKRPRREAGTSTAGSRRTCASTSVVATARSSCSRRRTRRKSSGTPFARSDSLTFRSDGALLRRRRMGSVRLAVQARL